MFRPPSPCPRALAGLALFCLLGGLSAEAWRWSLWPTAQAAALPPSSANDEAPERQPAPVRLTEVHAQQIDMPAGVPSAHASALAVLPGQQLLAFWWAGAHESAADVQVYMSRWSGRQWQAPRSVVDRETLSQALGFGVRRIGNPAAWVAEDGRIHLYVVATGLGGWAASRVVHLVANDAQSAFQVRRLLPLSPMFNTSVLVRTAPVGLDDGGWWLPAYFELGNKYPMLLAFDRRGEPRGITRIGSRTTVLQPAVVPVGRQEVRAWMRDRSDQRLVQQAVSHDGGHSWQDLPPSRVPNQDSSVAALKLREGGFVMLHNDQVDGTGSPRARLRLSASPDGQTWTPMLDVAKGRPDEEFSYPSVQQVGEELHVTYTARRRAIAHHVYRIDLDDANP